MKNITRPCIIDKIPVGERRPKEGIPEREDNLKWKEMRKHRSAGK